MTVILGIFFLISILCSWTLINLNFDRFHSFIHVLIEHVIYVRWMENDVFEMNNLKFLFITLSNSDTYALHQFNDSSRFRWWMNLNHRRWIRRNSCYSNLIPCWYTKKMMLMLFTYMRLWWCLAMSQWLFEISK